MSAHWFVCSQDYAVKNTNFDQTFWQREP